MIKMNKAKFFFSLIGLIILYTGAVTAQEAAINKGIQWLKGTQNTSGSWGDESMIASAYFSSY
jgi:hypothetical protein